MRLRRAIVTSKIPNFPCCNMVESNGPERTKRPTADGIPIIRIQRKAQSSDAENSLTDLSACLRDKCGSTTTAIATPKTPKGKLVIRSEKYNQVILPSRKNDANNVSINKLICATDTPKTAGTISLMTFLTPSSRQNICGRGNKCKCFRNGS